ncbi:hypothetical protein [uncultured Dokdonia sp.]|uniref:hypothetical protein n=1 Tax=uncultured Dokdonia sp. TaxID=575653 RepID=UPI002634EA02|nr:hypothetical protein [uncultured Dokdonia sp.]
MADFFFFTEQDAQSTSQLTEQAFGPLVNEPLSFESYRVNNLFTVKPNASAIAVTDSIPFVQQCSGVGNENLVNIVLLPISNPNFNFPTIKFYVYRGIDKNSLFTNDGVIKQPDNSWKANNILKILHDLQDQINIDNEVTGIEPTYESLGYHYSIIGSENFQADEAYLETTIFKEDAIQLPIVKAGCHIGKFTGGTIPAGFQMIHDRMGYEPTLGNIRTSDSIIEVTPLVVTPPSLPNISDEFGYTHEKEAILTYIDPTGFYGCAQANGIKVSTYTTISDADGGKVIASEIVNLFYNKEIVYIDIRNDQNYSYDYYKNFGAQLRLSYEQNGSDELVVETINYNDDWPLLRISQKELPQKDSLSKIILEFPFKGVSSHSNRFYLNSFTHDFLSETKPKTSFLRLNDFDENNQFKIEYSEEITLSNWVQENGSLGANYFIFKYSNIQNSGNNQVLRTKNLDSLFSLDMKLLLGDEDVNDGDFKTYIYSSMNAPLIDKYNDHDDSQDVYLPKIGIAKDKHHITFFAFKDRSNYAARVDSLDYPFDLVNTGKYNNTVRLDEYEYDPNDKSLGFLAALPYRTPSKDLKLKMVNHLFIKGNLSEERDYLYYLNSNSTSKGNISLDPRTLDCLTITIAEYEALLQANKVRTGKEYRGYLHLTGNEHYSGALFHIEEFKLGLRGIFISEADGSIGIDNVTINNEGTDDFFINGLINKA